MVKILLINIQIYLNINKETNFEYDFWAKFKALSLVLSLSLQLLTAFDALKGIGVVHSDLKPDNVMLTNHQGEPFRVKLRDFGVSFPTSKEHRGHTIQPLGYRYIHSAQLIMEHID